MGSSLLGWAVPSAPSAPLPGCPSAIAELSFYAQGVYSRCKHHGGKDWVTPWVSPMRAGSPHFGLNEGGSEEHWHHAPVLPKWPEPPHARVEADPHTPGAHRVACSRAREKEA